MCLVLIRGGLRDCGIANARLRAPRGGDGGGYEIPVEKLIFRWWPDVSRGTWKRGCNNEFDFSKVSTVIFQSIDIVDYKVTGCYCLQCNKAMLLEFIQNTGSTLLTGTNSMGIIYQYLLKNYFKIKLEEFYRIKKELGEEHFSKQQIR